MTSNVKEKWVGEGKDGKEKKCVNFLIGFQSYLLKKNTLNSNYILFIIFFNIFN